MNFRAKSLLLSSLFCFTAQAQDKAAAVLEMQDKPRPAWEQRIATGTKAVFVLDVSRPAFGVSFRDPNGLIWSSLLRDEKGIIKKFNHQVDAQKACREAGGRLATRADVQSMLQTIGGADEKGLTAAAFSPLSTTGLEVIADFNVGPIILGDTPEVTRGFQNWYVFDPLELYKNLGLWRFREVSIVGKGQSWAARCVAKDPNGQ